MARRTMEVIGVQMQARLPISDLVACESHMAGLKELGFGKGLCVVSLSSWDFGLQNVLC